MTEERRTKPSTAARKPGHAALGGRVLALGLSTSAAIVFAAAMADAASPSAASNPTAATPPSAAPIVVHVVLPNGQSVDSTVTAPPPVAAVPAAVPASTRSRGS